MTGNIVHRIEPKDWIVWYADSTAKNGIRILPLHPDDVAQINEWAKVFDNIEGRIASSPEVEFNITECKHAKLIYPIE